MEEITNEWTSLNDFIYATVFGLEFKVGADNRKEVIDQRSADGKKAFVPNIFPYQIDQGYHFVSWYANNQQPPITDDMINIDIQDAIRSLLQGSATDYSSSTTQVFDYCWYENPKQSIPGIYHLQVFWVPL